MRKYLYLLKLQIDLITNYKFDLYWRWIFSIGYMLFPIMIWKFSAENQAETKRIILYFFLFYGFISHTHTSRIAQNINQSINSGDIKKFLIRPISYPIVEMINIISVILSRLIIPFFLIVIGVFIFPEYLAPSSFPNLLISIVLVTIGIFVWNLILIAFSFLAFWVNEISSLVITIDLIFNFLKGYYVPAFLFPDLLRKSLVFTPIPYMISYPIEIYQYGSSTNEILKSITILIAWGIILIIFVKTIYKKGLKKYESFGA